MDGYLRTTKSHSYSLLFALPLLLLYESGAAWVESDGGSGLRNGADVLLRSLLAAGGVDGTLPLAVIVIVAGAVLIAAERRKRRIPLRATPFLGMVAESVVYALALGSVVGGATQWLLDGAGIGLAAQTGPLATLSLREAVVLSLGAGFYEELVFRVLLVGGIYGVFRSSGLSRRQAGGFSAILAALIFSGFHYIGPFGDPWGIPSFTFRFLAGLAFSLLFLIRGFGIAAWTHALYDIAILGVRAL